MAYLDNWIIRTSNTTNNLNGISFGNNTFAAVGSGNTAIISNDNGITWSIRYPSLASIGICYGNSTFVAVGDGGTILVSIDNGVSWAPRSSGISNILRGVSFGTNTFVAAGDGGIIIESDPPLPSRGINFFI